MEKHVEWVLANCELNDMEKDFLVNDLLYDFDSVQDAMTYMEDIVTYGCISGCVPYLIYTTEIHGYLSHFSMEIDELLQELLYNGYQIEFESMDKLVWCAFEYMVTKMIWHMEGAIDELQEY